jgi:hypothetical protein
VSRPLRWVPDSVQFLGVAPRNRECTWRLAKLPNNGSPIPSDSTADSTDAVVIGPTTTDWPLRPTWPTPARTCSSWRLSPIPAARFEAPNL